MPIHSPSCSPMLLMSIIPAERAVRNKSSATKSVLRETPLDRPNRTPVGNRRIPITNNVISVEGEKLFITISSLPLKSATQKPKINKNAITL